MGDDKHDHDGFVAGYNVGLDGEDSDELRDQYLSYVEP